MHSERHGLFGGRLTEFSEREAYTGMAVIHPGVEIPYSPRRCDCASLLQVTDMLQLLAHGTILA